MPARTVSSGPVRERSRGGGPRRTGCSPAHAGAMAPPSTLTEDGSETQFGPPSLGHFVLINRLASLIRPGGRVVSLSSSGHRIANVDLDDPNFERTPYQPYRAY